MRRRGRARGRESAELRGGAAQATTATWLGWRGWRNGQRVVVFPNSPNDNIGPNKNIGTLLSKYFFPIVPIARILAKIVGLYFQNTDLDINMMDAMGFSHQKRW